MHNLIGLGLCSFYQMMVVVGLCSFYQMMVVVGLCNFYQMMVIVVIGVVCRMPCMAVNKMNRLSKCFPHKQTKAI